MNIHLHRATKITGVEAKTIGVDGTTHLLDFTVTERDGKEENFTIFFDTKKCMNTAVKGMALALLEAV